MTGSKGFKTAAMVSEGILILWVLLSVFSLIFQDSCISFMISGDVLEKTESVIPYSVIVQLAGVLFVSICNILVIKEKSGVAVLVLGAIAAGIVPIAGYFIDIQQNYVCGHLQGAEVLARLAGANHVGAILSYLIYAGFTVAVAAAAVCAYAGRKN